MIRRIARALADAVAARRAWTALFLVTLVAVSTLALTPPGAVSPSLGWDKLNHLASFAALALSATLGRPASRGRGLLPMAALLAFGGWIEVMQQFVPGRTPDWADLLADAVGLACGMALAAGLLKVAARTSPPPPRPDDPASH